MCFELSGIFSFLHSQESGGKDCIVELCCGVQI